MFALTLIVGVLILGSLLPEFELVRVAWPLVDGPEPVIPGTIRVLASNAEILLFILLVPRISRGTGKAYIWWAVLSLAVCMALTIFLIAALGGFAATRLFPLQTAAAVARGEAGELVQAGRDDPALSADGLLDVMQSAYKSGLAPKSRMIDLKNAVRGEPPVAGTLALIEYVPTSQSDQKPQTPEEPLPEALFSQDNGQTSQKEPEEDESSGGQDSSEGGEAAKNSSREQEEKRLRLSGSAMFDGEELVGFLNPAATRGLEWMRKDMKNATVTV